MLAFESCEMDLCRIVNALLPVLLSDGALPQREALRAFAARASATITSHEAKPLFRLLNHLPLYVEALGIEFYIRALDSVNDFLLVLFDVLDLPQL